MGVPTFRGPAARQPDRFDRFGIDWSSWLPLASDAADHLDGVLLWLPDLAERRKAVEDAILSPADPALRPGERALVRTASARLTGSLATASVAARAAALRLNRPRDVDLLLAEGLDAPLNGRLGALVAAARGLGASRPALSDETLDRLERAGLVEDEMLEVVLSAAIAAWTDRLALSLGEAVLLTD